MWARCEGGRVRIRERERETREDASEEVGDNVREIQWEEEWERPNWKAGTTGEERRKTKQKTVKRREAESGIFWAAAARPLYRYIREMSMSKPVPSLLGSTAVASQRGRGDKHQHWACSTLKATEKKKRRFQLFSLPVCSVLQLCTSFRLPLQLALTDTWHRQRRSQIWLHSGWNLTGVSDNWLI